MPKYRVTFITVSHRFLEVPITMKVTAETSTDAAEKVRRRLQSDGVRAMNDPYVEQVREQVEPKAAAAIDEATLARLRAKGQSPESTKFATHKYRANPTTYNGRRYDSKAEAVRAEDLDLLLSARQILYWQPQPTFFLGCPENVYRPDFLIWNMVGGTWVEDVKGFETPAFKKNKRLWAKYGPCPLIVLKRKGKSWSKEIVDGLEALNG